MRVRFIPPAKKELVEQSRYYDRQVDGLGNAFLDEVQKAIRRMKEHPKAPAEDKETGTRRARLRRFPFTLVYRIEGYEIVVFAVSHDKRAPGYWIKRLRR